jgi:hypothetical protein
MNVPPLRLLLLTALLLSFSAVGYAQKYCPVPPPSPFKHSAQIVTKYDSKARRMKTTLEHPVALTKQGGSVYLYAEFFYQDPRLRARPSLEVAFISVSKEALYRNARTLNITLDGQPLALFAPVQYKSQKGEKDTLIETTRVTLTYENLLALTRAKKVEARLGPTNFVLSKNHMESLREVASMMVPARPARGATR